MSCVFCDSFNHLSQNCNIHVSDKSRKSVISSKKLCADCLTKGCFNIECDNIKCCICYSNKHHSVFCPIRATASSFFIPNIDQNLFPRFLALLNRFEKQMMAFQSPIILKLCKLQTLIFANTINHDLLLSALKNETKVIVCKKVILYNDLTLAFVHESCYSLFETGAFKNCTIIAENIKLSNVKIYSDTFTSLLSTKTKILKLSKIRFLTKITLDKIFEMAPNLEKLDYEFDKLHGNKANTQLNDFFKKNYGKNFKKLKITVDHDLEVSKLIPFLLKEKSSPNITIELFVNVPYHERHDRDLFVVKLSKYFVPSTDTPSLSVYVGKWKQRTNSYDFVGTFVLKNVVAQ